MDVNKTNFIPIDNSAILYLALIRKDHTNTYRFTMNLTEPVCPDTLQKAVDRIWHRFPTIIAGFHNGFFQCCQVPAKIAPQVKPDPGQLITMTLEEIRSCAFRVYYQGSQISIEAFHALTDGFGAVACFTTLVAEYLRLKHGITIADVPPLMSTAESPKEHELSDSYLHYAQGKPLHISSRYAYQLPGGDLGRSAIYTQAINIPVQRLLDASHHHDVSITALISTAMANAIMELQQQEKPGSRLKPVRIMVPVDLRRMFPSKTFRNFILYVLPTLEPENTRDTVSATLRSFDQQIRSQAEPSRLASIMAYNVRTQQAWYFRMLPLCIKLALMRLVYRYFGESNSSITLTNVGNVRLPEEMQSYVHSMEVILTPRARSPYNCAMISNNGLMCIHLSRFPKESRLEEIFLRNLNSLLDGEQQ